MNRQVRSNSAFGWFRLVISWAVLTAFLAMLLVSVLIPRLAGGTQYTILTGSMRPHMPPGTLVVVRPVETHTLGIGDVITYQLESGEPDVVTHRIVGAGSNALGDPVFNTRGDDNAVVDEKVVTPVQIKGKLWYSIPYMGYATNVLTNSQRQTLIYVAAGGLLLYAGSMFAGATRDRRKSRLEVRV